MRLRQQVVEQFSFSHYDENEPIDTLCVLRSSRLHHRHRRRRRRRHRRRRRRPAVILMQLVAAQDFLCDSMMLANDFRIE
jgi:hypothetical protein